MSNMIASRIVGGNTAYRRMDSDYYPTPPEVTRALLDFLGIPRDNIIWEPACGNNHMVTVMRNYGYRTVGTDIQDGTDFLTAPLIDCDWIITNPPFSQAENFIRRCSMHKKPYALLLKSQYWHAKRRTKLFYDCRPSYILPLTWRPDFMFGERGGGSPLMDVMWCVWDYPACNYAEYKPLEKPKEKQP